MHAIAKIEFQRGGFPVPRKLRDGGSGKCLVPFQSSHHVPFWNQQSYALTAPAARTSEVLQMTPGDWVSSHDPHRGFQVSGFRLPQHAGCSLRSFPSRVDRHVTSCAPPSRGQKIESNSDVYSISDSR